MPKKPRRLISASAGGNRGKVAMVQEEESSDAQKVCPAVQYGPFSCLSCGRRYKYKSRYDKHRRRCADDVGGVVSKEIKMEARESSVAKSHNGDGGHLPPSLGCHLDTRRGHNGPAAPQPGEPPLIPVPRDGSRNNRSREVEPEAGSSWDAKEEPGDDGVPTPVKCQGPFTCVSCGKLYQYKSQYDRHLKKGCGDGVGGDLSSCPMATSSHLSQEIKMEARESSVDRTLNGDGGHLPPSLGPDDGGGVKRRKLERVLGDQAVCGTLATSSSAKSLEPHTNSLSLIQISNVKSLVTSQDEVGTSTEKGREPEGADPSSASRGQDGAFRHQARGDGKRRKVNKLKDNLRWRSWVRRCLGNRSRVAQKWLNPGGRRALCLLCGMRFSRKASLDQHMGSAHYESFQYRCCSCDLSFKAWTCLCRHVLQTHRVKIQRSPKTSEIEKAKKCILKAKDKDKGIAEAKFIHNVKDASTDVGLLGRLVNDAPGPNSEMCLFAVKDIQKGEAIVFSQGGADLLRCTSTQSKTTQTLRTYSKKEAAVRSVLPGQKVAGDESASLSLAQRAEELDAERREAQVKLSAAEERRHMADIVSAQSDLQTQVLQLMAANQKLAEELSATRTPPAPEAPRPASTPPTNSLPNRVNKQHPDMAIPELKAERELKISQLSAGRSDRYGCYLFQAAVGTRTYHAWCCNTNWSGVGGKWGLPRNLQEYLLNTLAEKFPGFGYRETRVFIDRINELLRKPRKFLYV
ncbi:hypothetical protein COCON_G00161430 [Conger conger]|uniref:C2H2-type domain-containing protein n=1 Tax=Conger conger TaxID=82655 RepID=A0A9Q1DA88_CONCO|nr:hypothetical protein COCON_G00161430 [Conger conger]